MADFPQPGQYIICEWDNGTQCVGEVLELACARSSSSDKPAAPVSSRSADSAEIYVHFPEYNRRMDDWFGMDRVVRAATPAEVAAAVQPPVTARETRKDIRKREAKEGQTLLSLPGVDPHVAMAAEAEHAASTRVKNVGAITLGAWSMRCWYFSPFPEGFRRVPVLHFHPLTLRYFPSRSALLRHHQTEGSAWLCPPGREIYRDMRPALAWKLNGVRGAASKAAAAAGLTLPHSFKSKGGRPSSKAGSSSASSRRATGPPGSSREQLAWPARLPKPSACAASGRRLVQLSVFEVDGSAHRLWCRQLCLLAKLFLDHKTLYFDVDPFLFYVLCEVDDRGQAHIAGYFSKEKQSPEGHNLACILTLPPYQGTGYAKLLISLSYALSRSSRAVGMPERPLSDLGRVTYEAYWKWATLRADPTSVVAVISALTGIAPADALVGLRLLGALHYSAGRRTLVIDSATVKHQLASRWGRYRSREVEAVWMRPLTGAASLPARALPEMALPAPPAPLVHEALPPADGDNTLPVHGSAASASSSSAAALAASLSAASGTEEVGEETPTSELLSVASTTTSGDGAGTDDDDFSDDDCSTSDDNGDGGGGNKDEADDVYVEEGSCDDSPDRIRSKRSRRAAAQPPASAHATGKRRGRRPLTLLDMLHLAPPPRASALRAVVRMAESS